MICLRSETMSEASTRIAIGARDGVIQVFDLDTKYRMHTVFSVRLDQTVPRAIYFFENPAKDVLVFSIFDGKV